MTLIQFIAVLSVLLNWFSVTGEGDRFLVCEGCNFTHTIREDSGIDTEVVTLSSADMSDHHILNTSIATGNTDKRFAVSPLGVVYVARLLDHDIQSEYNLSIGVTIRSFPLCIFEQFATNQSVANYNVTLRLLIDDVINWPRVFNESCAVKNRQNSDKGLLYKILVGKNKTPIEEYFSDDNIYNEFAVDTNNSNCNARLYTTTNLGEKMSLFKDFRHFKIECTGTMKTYPTITGFPQNDIAVVNNPFVDQQWFEDGHRHHIVLIIGLLHMSTTPDIGTCQVVYTPPGESEQHLPFRDEIEISPQGCPVGKYGLKCEEDCVCQNGGTCHPFNGACKCAVGWTGPACDIAITDTEPKIIRAIYGGIMRIVCYHYSYAVMDHHQDVTWYHNGNALDEDDDERFNMKQIGESRSSFTISMVHDNDAGIYECESKGSSEQKYRASAELIVIGMKGLQRHGVDCILQCCTV
ncbi:uncharacterized protein LOC144437452 [Glandiceps talaboti]